MPAFLTGLAVLTTCAHISYDNDKIQTNKTNDTVEFKLSPYDITTNLIISFYGASGVGKTY